MRVLLTGSSGQIGTNLALRLQRDGHWVFGVDKRANTWTDDVRHAAPGSRRPLPAVPRRDRRRRVPARSTSSCTWPAHAKVHQLVRQPHRALENAIMTFNVLEYCRAARAAARLLVDARGLRRRPPLRGVRRGRRRLRLHREPVLGVEDHLRGVHLLVRPLLRPRVPRLPLLERLRPLRQRPAADGARAAAVHPPDEPRRADHGLRRRRQGARLHLHRRLRRRDRARYRARSPTAASRTRRSTSPTARATRSCAPPS